MEQVLTSFNMEGYDSWPSGVPTTVCAQSTTMQEKLEDRILINHLKRFKYACYTGDEPPNPPDNSISDYGCNLCHWALHLLHLNDMAKEGDLARTSLSLKANIPFFYGHSKLSKLCGVSGSFAEDRSYMFPSNATPYSGRKLHQQAWRSGCKC